MLACTHYTYSISLQEYIMTILIWTTFVSTVHGQAATNHHTTDPKLAPERGIIAGDKFRVYGEWTSDGSYQLKLKNNITGTARVLPVGSGYIYNEIISPEGEHIAYLSESNDGIIELRVLSLQTEKTKTIFHSQEVLLAQLYEWSSNGKLIAASMFMKDRSFQYLLFDIDRNSFHVLRKDYFKSMNYNFQQSRICFSPDNRFIAYDCTSNGGWFPRDIYFQSTEKTGTEAVLIQNPSNDLLLGWAPDNRTILFASDRSGKWNFMSVEMENGKPTGATKILKEDVGNIFGSFGFVNLGFTKDGSYFYTIGQPKVSLFLSILGKDKSETQKVSSLTGFNTGVEWSHSGDSLAYVQGRGTEYDPFEIIIRNMISGKEHVVKIAELMRHGGHSFETRWSNDGNNMIAIARLRKFNGPEMDSQGLYKIELKTGKAEPIIRTESICGLDCIMAPLWCRDGTLIFKRRATETIVRMNLSTRVESEIYKGPSIGSIRTDPTTNMAISPNGKYLAFVLTDWKEGINSLMVLSLDGASHRPEELLRVSGNELVSIPSWMPDSKTLLYAHTRFADSISFELFKISLADKQPEPLGIANSEGLIPLSISVHPDGKKIAFTAGIRYNDSKEWWVLENVVSKSFKK